MRFSLLGALLAVGFLLPWAFSRAAEITVSMTEEGFSPQGVTIEKGDTVIFVNRDAGEHWPASNIHPTHSVYPNSSVYKCGGSEEKNMFDACRGIAQGEEYRFTFLYPGRWRYHDHLAAKQTGTIEVVGEPNTDTAGSTQTFSLSRAATYLKDLLVSLYYTVRPSARGAALESINMRAAAKDEQKIRSYLRFFGPEAVMNDLLSDAEGGPSVVDCHQEAHQTGRAAYELYGAEVFERGGPSCNSGFYHGAMEAFLTAKGTDNLAEKIDALCGVFRNRFSNFECLHGVGHGVMAYEDYDLPQAIALCEDLSSDFARQSCYGGVFMENIIAAQGLGAEGAHDTEWVSEDLHFPCNAIGGDYRKLYECYQMQTAWMLTLTNNDFPRVVAGCKTAPEDMIGVCFKSLGRDIAGYTNRRPENILSFCNFVPRTKDYYDQCIVGAVNVIVDYWGPAIKTQGQEFCTVVKEASAKKACDETLGWRLRELFGGEDGAR